jgi:dihydrolipoamide dehydrogenase
MARRDVVVLGGGPAGYAAALRAAGHGLSVSLVEQDKVGGTCLHRGCIPSKAMLHAGAVLDSARQAQAMGLDLTINGVVPFGLAHFRNKLVADLHDGLRRLLQARQVEVVKGRGILADDGRTVLIGNERISGRHVVVATGSSVRGLDGVQVDGRVVITSDEATQLDRVPQRAAIIGAGAVGLEFASMWRSLGAKEVTVIEALPRIAPMEDAEISRALVRSFERRKITTVAPANLDSVTVEGDFARIEVGIDISQEVRRELRVDTVLLAVGRAPNTAGIGLEALGIVDRRGYVKVDQWCQTAAGGVYAVGDLLAPPSPALAHAGFAEGFLAADVIAEIDEAAPIDYSLVPRVTYTSPEVASVGFTEQQARDRGHIVETTVYPLQGNAKALIDGGTDGLVKVVAEKGGSVLGIHVLGPHATDLIAEAQVITAWGALPSEVAALVHPHPTLAEAIGEAHLAAAGWPFHA